MSRRNQYGGETGVPLDKDTMILLFILELYLGVMQSNQE